MNQTMFIAHCWTVLTQKLSLLAQLKWKQSSAEWKKRFLGAVEIKPPLKAVLQRSVSVEITSCIIVSKNLGCLLEVFCMQVSCDMGSPLWAHLLAVVFLCLLYRKCVTVHLEGCNSYLLCLRVLVLQQWKLASVQSPVSLVSITHFTWKGCDNSEDAWENDKWHQHCQVLCRLRQPSMCQLHIDAADCNILQLSNHVAAVHLCCDILGTVVVPSPTNGPRHFY